MSSVTNNWDLHIAISMVFGENTLKSVRQIGEVGVLCKTFLENGWLNGDIASLVHKVRAVQVTLKFAGGKSGLGRVDVLAFGDERGRLVDQFLTAVFDVLVYSHSVFEIILEVALLRGLKQTTVVFFVEFLLVHAQEFLFGALVGTAIDTVSHALGSVLRVCLGEDIFSADAGNKASVARNALLTNVMLRSIDPSLRITAKISNHYITLSLLDL